MAIRYFKRTVSRKMKLFRVVLLLKLRTAEIHMGFFVVFKWSLEMVLIHDSCAFCVDTFVHNF